MLKKSGLDDAGAVDQGGDRRPERAVGRRHRGDPGARAAGRRRRPTATARSCRSRRCGSAFADFIPATSPLERELQILVAVQECTSREVLPEPYRAMDRGAVLARINELASLLNSCIRNDRPRSEVNCVAKPTV